MMRDRGSDVIGVEDWNALAGAVLLDTRSPGEYAAGHIPGAFNVPLFDNAERAEIGTLYKQQGKSVAMERGLEIIGPRMADLVRQVRALTDGRDEPVVVHCWRGGMRSNSVTWLLRTAGIPARRLDGGYKAYRRFVLAELGKLENLRILVGPTGSGKSPILRALAERGVITLRDGDRLDDLDARLCVLWGKANALGFAPEHGFDAAFMRGMQDHVEAIARLQIDRFMGELGLEGGGEDAARRGAEGLLVSRDVLALMQLRAVLAELRDRPGAPGAVEVR